MRTWRRTWLRIYSMSLSTRAAGWRATPSVRVIGEEGERWSAGAWTSATIERQLLGAIAVAVQRGQLIRGTFWRAEA